MSMKSQFLFGITMICGLMMSSPSQAIYSSDRAVKVKADEWTGVVWIDFGSDKKCSGSVIHPNLIVTAAHCVASTLNLKQVGLSFGTKMDFKKFKAFAVKNPYYTETYGNGNGDPKDAQQDIMFIRLETSLTSINPNIEIYKYVETLKQTESLLGSATIVGYGKGKEVSGGMARSMNENFLSGIKRTQKITTYYNSKYNVIVADDSAVCQGDSGGGLFVTINNNKYTLGVVSGNAGAKKCQKVSQALFVVLADHLCWIESASGIDLNLKQKCEKTTLNSVEVI